MDNRDLILVCFAVKPEARYFRPPSQLPVRPKICLTGIGRANATRAVREQIRAAPPALILSCGFAGGLNPALETGALIFADDGPEHVNALLLKLGAQPAAFHASDHVIIRADDKQALWQQTAADAVDMESEAIRHLARDHGIASATIRVISDSAREDLPCDFNSWMTPDQRLSPRRMAGQLLRSPGLIGPLLSFQKQTARAAQRLGALLVQLLQQWPPR